MDKSWKINAKTAAFFGMLGFFVLSMLILATPALAQDAFTEVGAASGLSATPVPIIIARLIRAVLGIMGILLTVLILYGGFVWMTAGGDPTKLNKAKAILKNAVVGFVIVLASFTITQFILTRLLSAAGLSGGISSRADQFFEPLSGSLGAGIVQDHFPPRNALDVARNTKIFVTFKEPIDPASIIQGYSANPAATDLNTDSIKIYPTEAGEGAALAAGDVVAAVDQTFQTFVFDPKPLLGDGAKDINYTVFLTSNIRKVGGAAAFTGSNQGGYEWTFEVGTEVDLTPPKVVSVIPTDTGRPYARNITVTLTFNEAMDPVAGTGKFIPPTDNFSNIAVMDGATQVPGTFTISNGYRTIDFTTTDACGKDPCGDTIYCLPGPSSIDVTAKAASLGDSPPQAQMIGVTYDGLADASGNSLDGNGDGTAVGPEADNYAWNFETGESVNLDKPVIDEVSPGVETGDADLDRDVEITFSIPMKASTLTAANIQLWPEPKHIFWFSVGTASLNASNQIAAPNEAVARSRAVIGHPTLVPPEIALGQFYYPIVTQGVKSSYQICMYPAIGPSSTPTGQPPCNGRDYCCNGQATSLPYCCGGAPSATACAYLSD